MTQIHIHSTSGDSVPAGAPSEAAAETRTALVERLFREHNNALVRFLVAKLHSQQEARDIAQEAYVRLLQLDVPDAVSYLRAFLFKTASNLAIDRLRARKAETRRLEMEFFDEFTVAPNPEQGVVAAKELQLIEELLGRLSPKCRQAFLLQRFDGLSCPEIARRMKIPERTVRHYIVEAIVYCRSRLDRTMGSQK